jgi:hypothetical protein
MAAAKARVPAHCLCTLSDDRRPPEVGETTPGERKQIRTRATKDGREESAAAKEKSRGERRLQGKFVQ